jgi:hypothetical protein
MQLATKTLAAINAALEADQGGAYRQNLQKVLPHMDDAYRGADEGFRNHLGASLIGRKCAREIWYGFRWTKRPRFDGRMIRLFNRGHLEEARFIAMLLTIGVNVIQQDANGKQYKVSYFGGLFGGSGDGIGYGVPDFPPGTYCLLEFKTYSKKTFDDLIKKGVREYKPEHYSQMQVYLRGMGLGVALYAAVCKDDDRLHLELIHLDPAQGEAMVQRAYNIITIQRAPQRINESAGWYECRFCDYKDICRDPMPTVERNCRTCHHVRINTESGTWACGQTGEVLTKEKQLEGCKEDYLIFNV